ncbi:MAG TPA: phytase [Opitutus sp.]|nr:phytase [Opitutus sp.]
MTAAQRARRSVFAAVCGALAAPALAAGGPVIAPRVITAPVAHDSDDPAIWINRAEPARSLILGTDKDATDGGLYVFDLAGRMLSEKTVHGLARPNNVDVAYDFDLGGRRVDVAVVTERNASRLRVFTVPDMRPVDGGGLPVFDGDRKRLPMGIALYRRPADGTLFAIVSGRIGPREGYLWQYRLEDDGRGVVRAVKVRAFGRFSGVKEIEAVAVDQALGHVYYSDERTGVREYRADPDAPDAARELALFATSGFVGDREGISIYPTGAATGYILVSNQDGNTFEVFAREGTVRSPFEHRHVASLRLATHASDGSDVTAQALGPKYPGGLLVAMSEERTFHLYAWADLQDAIVRASAGHQVPRRTRTSCGFVPKFRPQSVSSPFQMRMGRNSPRS